MADLNSLIAQGVQFRAPPDPFAQYAQMQQLQQGATQNQLAQYQLGAAQRADVQSNALNAAYAGNLDPNTGAINYGGVARSLAGSGAGSQIPAAMKSQFEQQQAQTKLIKDKLELLPGMYQRADTPEAYAALQNMVHSDPVLGPWLDSQGATKEKGVASLQNAVNTGKFNDLRIGSMQSVTQILDAMKPIVTAAGASVFDPRTQTFIGTAPEKTPSYAPSADQQGYETAKSEGFKGNFVDYKVQLARESRPPPLPRPEQPPVAVVDPVTGKQVYVTREQALSGKMTPASAMEGLSPKEIQQREAKYPQATSAIKTFESKTDSLATDMEKLANHPGLSGISGLIYGRTPALTKDALAAQALYDSIVARGGFAELQAMRASSPTGGALGNVSNQEGQYLRDAFAPISRTQDTSDLKTALKNAADVARASKQRVRDAYDMTYEYKTQGGAPAAAPAAAPNALSSAEQAELEQLRKRFGGK